MEAKENAATTLFSLYVVDENKEGRVVIGQQSTIDILVELIHSGSDRNKENVAAVLLVLGINDSSHLLAAMQISVYEYLIELVQNSTSRARRSGRGIAERTKLPDTKLALQPDS